MMDKSPASGPFQGREAGLSRGRKRLYDFVVLAEGIIFK